MKRLLDMSHFNAGIYESAIPTSTNEAYGKVEREGREEGHELVEIQPPPPLPLANPEETY